jgi:hypothetical protein
MSSSPLASHLISLVSAAPLFVVWIVGIVVALVRWRKHPSVSALLAGALLALLVLSLTTRLASFLIIQSSQQPGRSVQATGLYLGILAIAGSLIRTGAWAAVLVALFGWRPLPGERPAGAPWQFSILGLMGVTLAVAVLCGFARWLVSWLGESATHLIQLLDDVPLFVCWLVGLGVAIWRWKRHPQVSLLAVLGIGTSIANTVIWQIVWITVTTGNRFGWIPVLNVFSALAAATGWALLIAAVLHDREVAVGPAATVP